MGNLDVYNKFREVPDNAKRNIAAGRLKGKTDINPMWRIKCLTEQYGPCGIGWYYVPVQKWIEKHGEETAAFVDIELFVKVDGEWSKPISGTGGSMLAAKEKSGIYVSDECYKMATTDALSAACKQLGIGADVYWAGDSTKYDRQAEEPGKGDGSTGGKREILEPKYVNTLWAELKRTGVGAKRIYRQYGVTDIHDLTFEQWKDAMEILKAKPDAPKPPADLDTDPEMPWNEPKGK